MITRKKPLTARVAFFSVVHATYFDQFEGLRESLTRYHKDTVALIEKNGVTVVDHGFVEDNTAAFAVADKIAGNKIDLIFCNMITYATSSVFAPILQNTKAPVVLVALQPRMGLDYTKASTFMQLDNDNICSVPEFTGVAIRMGRPVTDVVIGCLYDDPAAERELILAEFEIPDPKSDPVTKKLTEADLARAAHGAAALDRLIDTFKLDGLAYYYEGHDGPHHIAIAEGKPILRSLTKFHGKPGSGASVEFKLKEGPITMLGITQNAAGGFKFVIGEGEVQAPTHLNLLSVDNTFGEFPEDCVYEPLPHFLKAAKEAPDTPSPVVWVYPFGDAYVTIEGRTYYEVRNVTGTITFSMPWRKFPKE